MSIDWANPAAGFAVGVLVGLTGIGGGSLMTPMLVLMFGVAPVAAVGTDLWFAAITKLVGGTFHHQRGSVDWQVVRRLSLGSLPAAAFTLWWLNVNGMAQMRQGLIISLLGTVLVLTALAMLLKSQLHAIGQELRTRAPERFKNAQPALTVVAGLLLGVLVTLTSIGAGALGTVMLLYLYPFRMTPARLIGTDIVHAIPLTMLAGIGHLLMGNVDLGLLVQLLLGSIPGIALGSLIGSRVSETLLRRAISVMLVAVGAKLLIS